MEIRCPKCQKKSTWENNSFRPFCSKECKERDLGSWATEEYRIPEEETTSETLPPTPPKKEK